MKLNLCRMPYTYFIILLSLLSTVSTEHIIKVSNTFFENKRKIISSTQFLW